jgi:hypothetical protein
MRRYVCLFATVVACCFCSVVRAHGPQLQITNDAEKIVTRNIFVEAPYATLTPPRSVYVMPVKEFDGSWYARPNGTIDPVLGEPVYFSGPGLAYGQDQVDGEPRAFEAGTSFSLNFTGGLKRWDGTAFVDSGTEQIHAFRGSPVAPSATAVTSDSAPFAGLAFAPIAEDYDEEAHSSARFRLLGDGTDPLTASQDGVFLLSLSISSTQTGLEDSDEFFYVLNKGAAATDLAAAVSSLGVDGSLVQYVPEPSSIALAGIFLSLGLASVRIRR